ncbi:potassium channel family protein [Arhodomonas sp. AD133]|uniref:potassium channel family protein n=1 Tax=Arhodomonas sp. AD133 TaxID=3415009 RepID=UPI003EBC3461
MLHLLKRRRHRLPVVTTQTLRHSLIRTGVMLAAVVVAHVLAMMAFEGLAPWPAVWLTATTLTTVGYGDLSATTPPGQFATVALSYALGIFLLANLATYWIDYRAERRARMLRGQWRWGMEHHIVILNAPARRPARYFERLVQEIRHWDGFSETPVQIVTEAFPDGLPATLRENGVVHYHGNPDDPDVLRAVDIHAADHIVVLAEAEDDARADTLSLGLVDRLSDAGVTGHVIIECVTDRNRARFKRFMPAATILRPVRGYPEILARALAAPGTERVLEDLFQHQGVHPRRYDATFDSLHWAELVTRFVNAGYGTPLAYLDRSGEVVSSPCTAEMLSGSAVFVLVDEARAPGADQVRALLG